MSNRAPTALPPFDRAKTLAMAKEAGFCFITQHDGTIHPEHSDLIERFAALVRAQVLEEAAQKAERLAEKDQPGAALCRTVLTAATIRALK